MSEQRHLRAVQYHPHYCKEAADDLARNGDNFTRFDSSHDLSILDKTGKRHRIGSFKHADWAYAVGKLIEDHGLPGLEVGDE
ncbi:MAG: hypothetical protein ACWA40_07400 [Planktomarina sp.]